MIVLMLIMLVGLITTCYWAKVKSDQLENYYKRQRNERNQGSSEGTLPEERSHRRHTSRRRSGSDRLHRRQDVGGSDFSNQLMGSSSTLQQRRHSDDRKGGGSLNRENLDRLGRQSDSQPALLFVAEEDQELLEQQLNASYHTRTTNRASSENNPHAVVNSEKKNTSGVTRTSQELTNNTTLPKTDQ